MHNGDSNLITREYFENILLEVRHIDGVLPSAKVKFFEEEFDTPVSTAALSHLNNTAPDGMKKMAAGAKKSNALCFSGMAEKDEVLEMCSTGAKVVKIIKPHADNEKVFEKIREAEDAGCFAIGMDIDHAFNSAGGYDVVTGLPMKPKSFEEIKSFINATKLPFVVKGVLSVQDAEKSLEAGAKGIIVSHHHGIMRYAVPPLMILPEIVKAVGGKMTIFVDCCIESGMDAFKCLALGADGVCVGRAIMDSLKEKGSDGVSEKINSITDELRCAMARTGFGTVEEINDSVIHFWR